MIYSPASYPTAPVAGATVRTVADEHSERLGDVAIMFTDLSTLYLTKKEASDLAALLTQAATGALE